MSATGYVPDAGDIVLIQAEPNTGGRRRAMLVLSPAAYNSKTGRIVGCHVTTIRKSYPFEVALHGTRSVALADRLHSVGWVGSKLTQKKSSVSLRELSEVRRKVTALIAAEIPTNQRGIKS